MITLIFTYFILYVSQNTTNITYKYPTYIIYILDISFWYTHLTHIIYIFLQIYILLISFSYLTCIMYVQMPYIFIYLNVYMSNHAKLRLLTPPIRKAGT